MTIGHLHVPGFSIDSPDARIAAFCEQWRIVEFAFFGSVVRGEMRVTSDLNVLVSFEVGAHYGMFDIVLMEGELKELLGRDVMILTRRGVELSSNPIRRKEILESAEVVYAKRPRT
jgi:hypothetical protein